MQCTGNICQPLLERFQHDPASATQYLRDQGFPIHPSSGYELGVNALVHMLVLFAALTFLFIFVVSQAETKALQGEFDDALSTHLHDALVEANEKSHGTLRNALSHMADPIRVLQSTVSQPDATTTVYNEGLYIHAALIVGMITAALLATLFVLSYSAGIPVASSFAFILISNAVLFMLVGGTEFMFFKKVALHYVPVKPSYITQQIIEDLKIPFAPAKTADA